MRCSLKMVNAGRPCTSSSVVACAIAPIPRTSLLSGKPVTTPRTNHADAPTAAHAATATATIHATNSRRLVRTAAASFSEMFMIPV
jgi:hypothetical protein